MTGPLAGLRVTLGEQVIDVPRMLDAMNQRVEVLYDRDHCVGHAYFTPLAKVPDGDERLVALQQVFSTRILPLLEEYFFEDWQKNRKQYREEERYSAAGVRHTPTTDMAVNATPEERRKRYEEAWAYGGLVEFEIAEIEFFLGRGIARQHGGRAAFPDADFEQVARRAGLEVEEGAPQGIGVETEPARNGVDLLPSQHRTLC